jgi:hypothetical protein
MRAGCAPVSGRVQSFTVAAGHAARGVAFCTSAAFGLE